MAKKTKPESVSPETKPEPVKGAGVNQVRRSTSSQQAQGEKRKILGFTAAEAAAGFPKGGAAFVRWAETQGIQPDTRKTEAEWAPIIKAFAERPIHGHRRTAEGGNHRINKAHRR